MIFSIISKAVALHSMKVIKVNVDICMGTYVVTHGKIIHVNEHDH